MISRLRKMSKRRRKIAFKKLAQSTWNVPKELNIGPMRFVLEKFHDIFAKVAANAGLDRFDTEN